MTDQSPQAPPSEPRADAEPTTDLRQRLKNPEGHGVMHQEALEEIEHLDHALRIAGHNIVELNDQRAKLTGALNTALILVDQLVNELRIAGLKPPGTVVVAKARLDQEMRKLLGE